MEPWAYQLALREIRNNPKIIVLDERCLYWNQSKFLSLHCITFSFLYICALKLSFLLTIERIWRTLHQKGFLCAVFQLCCKLCQPLKRADNLVSGLQIAACGAWRSNGESTAVSLSWTWSFAYLSPYLTSRMPDQSSPENANRSVYFTIIWIYANCRKFLILTYHQSFLFQCLKQVCCVSSMKMNMGQGRSREWWDLPHARTSVL